MNYSPKFLAINRLKQHEDFHHLVPDFERVPRCPVELVHFEDSFKGADTFILRSSLEGESGDKLNSGKSISIKNLKSYRDFKQAHLQMASQPRLDQMVLQKQVDLNKHVTGIYCNDVIYLENTYGDEDFCYITEETYVGALKAPAHLFQTLKSIAKYLDDDRLIFEIGLDNENIVIYQIMSLVDSQNVQALFRKNRVSEILDNQPRANEFRWSHEFKNALAAKRLRRQFRKSALEIGDYNNVVLNWRSIIHFYNLYSILYRKPQFLEFYSWVSKPSNLFARLAKEHFEIASYLSEGQFIPQGFIDDYKGLIFLGTEQRLSEVGQEAVLLEDLDPREVYGLRPGTLILTKNSHLLCHGYLAAVERGLDLVGNISDSMWSQLKVGKKVQVHFADEKLEIV